MKRFLNYFCKCKSFFVTSKKKKKINVGFFFFYSRMLHSRSILFIDYQGGKQTPNHMISQLDIFTRLINDSNLFIEFYWHPLFNSFFFSIYLNRYWYEFISFCQCNIIFRRLWIEPISVESCTYVQSYYFDRR